MTHQQFESATAKSPPDSCWTFPAPEQTAHAARLLGECLDADGLVLALVGPLGAGKTLFVKGLAEGLGIQPERVTSPTFVIAGEYAAAEGRTLHHIDLYRIESVPELEQTGFIDLLNPGAVIAIEWADRFPQELPSDHLWLELARAPVSSQQSDSRQARVRAAGPSAARLLERWRDKMPQEAKGSGASWR